MSRQAVHADAAPKAVGPYSQAVIAGDLVFCSGQLPIDPATGEFCPGGVEAQTHQVLKNLRAVLEQAGSGLDHVVKATVFMKDLEQFVAMNGVYTEYFAEPAPARSTFQIARLPRDAMVEIEVIARIP